MGRKINVVQYLAQQLVVALSSTEQLKTSIEIKQRRTGSFPSVCNMQIDQLSEDDETGRFQTAHTESSRTMGLTELPANDSPLCWSIC